MQGSARLADPTLLRTGAYVDGAWLYDGGAGTFTVANPSTGGHLAELPALSSEQVREAIGAAHLALPGWRSLAAKDRSKIIRHWFDLVTEHTDDLAAIITLEEGKPLAEARAEVAYAASFIEWFAEEAKRVRGDVFSAPAASRRIVVLKEPVGVCAAITPWNFPAAMITRKAAPALAAGCTMIVKPAKQTPLTALALAELGNRAGIPAGVLNVVLGESRDIGPELTSSPLVRKLTFTGSTEVGRILLEQSAATIKKVSMELGGNAPVIVFDDADLETALTGVLAAKYRNTGESCIGANRVYVQAGIYDRFAKEFAERAARLPVGDGFTEGIALGPLIDAAAVDKVTEHVSDAVAHGAKLLTGGARHRQGPLFFQPTVLAGVTQPMLVAREETFGPITPLIRFTDEAEVIGWANDSEFGLAAYLFSRDAERIWKTAAALEAGMVGINTGLISNEVAPFGGIKQSGIGREGSIYGIDEYLEIKYLAWQGAGE
jgi:succinate-semialdehyde dehydrogenase/glutarate-semialdehyde dehydrogenase